MSVVSDHVIICPSLIIGIGIGIGRYMVHVSWLRKLILIRALAVILAMSALIEVNFLGKLCVKLLVSGHLAEVIVSKRVGPCDLPWSHRSKVDFVLVVHSIIRINFVDEFTY